MAKNAGQHPPVGYLEKAAGQKEDEDDDHGAEDCAIIVKEIGPEEFFEQDEGGRPPARTPFRPRQAGT